MNPTPTPTDTGGFTVPPYIRVYVEIRYTGTLITPDDSDTNGYGEPCEPGYGYEISDGWVDPAWSLWDVREEYPETPHDTIDTGDDYDLDSLLDEYGGDLEDMIRDRVSRVIGSIDSEGWGTFYASDPLTNYRTGETLTLAAHIKGGTYAK